MTIFLGCGFAAKYREGGGNFSVPLQWMLGLRRLKLDAIWLELLPATNDVAEDEARIRNFQNLLRAHGLSGRYCLLYQKPASDEHGNFLLDDQNGDGAVVPSRILDNRTQCSR